MIGVAGDPAAVEHGQPLGRLITPQRDDVGGADTQWRVCERPILVVAQLDVLHAEEVVGGIELSCPEGTQIP